jgi:hypothetical protein
MIEEIGNQIFNFLDKEKYYEFLKNSPDIINKQEYRINSYPKIFDIAQYIYNEDIKNLSKFVDSKNINSFFDYPFSYQIDSVGYYVIHYDFTKMPIPFCVDGLCGSAYSYYIKAYPIYFSPKEKFYQKLTLDLFIKKKNNLEKIKWTLLHYASSLGKQEVVNFLLNFGADLDLKDFLGSNAEDVSKFMGYNLKFIASYKKCEFQSYFDINILYLN